MRKRQKTDNWNAHLLKLKADCLLVQPASADEADQWYKRAVATARQQGARMLELRATVSLCKLWQTQGKSPAAYARLAEVYGWFQEGFDMPDLLETKTLLTQLA